MPITAFASTYAPRRCGIATFTHDLATAVGDREIVALHPRDEPGTYPAEVRHRVRRDVLTDYLAAAGRLNAGSAGVVSIQHEYGIWGGPDGEYVLNFVRALEKPVVTTLHTVLRHPTPHQRSVLTSLISGSDASVVMSRSAADLLTRIYDVDPRRLDVIPHGVPDLPLVPSDSVKSRLGIQGGPVILSFGLLGPGKGLETVIAAMPAVLAAVPRARYVIVGATHPGLVCCEGEAYREGLQKRATELGVADRVMFVDRFVGKAELAAWLMAADVFVTPYPNLEQIVSGTLAYAMSAGRAVISTPYTYATELLGNGRGRLVEPGSPDALARAFIDLLCDDAQRLALGRLAYTYTRSMVWPQVGAQYRRLFERVATKRVAALDNVGAVGAFRA
ncbi:MAG: glycosyltransferase family 4 protein [Candidatus Limnocylindrales bacterium]